MNKNFQWWLVRIDRLTAWILLGAIVLFFISGYGITKGIIDAEFASKLHTDLLPAIVLIAFVIHTFLAIRMTLTRGLRWNNLSLASLILIYLGFIATFGYFEFFYNRPAANSANESIQNTAQSAEKIFTFKELAEYNGKNGQPAYAAVDGIVYDVSALFINGQHYGYAAGQDLTAAFYSRHAKKELADVPIIGKLTD